MADPWDTVDTLTLPVGANRSDRVVGRSETGDLVYQTIHGQQYSLGMGYQPARKSVVKATYNALRADPIGALAGAGGAVVNSLANTIAVPANALAGRPVTYGDVMDVAGMVQLGGAAMPAPKGALRSGAMREAATEAQSKADEVLQLLKSGRGSEVTDEMLSAADPQYLWANYDLPMDAASRMERARGMAFDTETPLYHGTDTSFYSFKPSKNGNWGEGVYLAHDPSIASDFALEKSSSMNYGGDPRILTVVSKGKYPSVNSETFTKSEMGFDANLRGGVKYRVVPDPSNIRSRFARFDPRLAHLANLNASNASPAIGVASVASQSQQEQDARTLEILQYLGLR